MSIQKTLQSLLTHQFFCVLLNARYLVSGMSHLTSNSQQDPVEEVDLDDLKRTSILTNDLVTNTLRTAITCNTCLFSAAKEEKCEILPLPVSSNI